MSNSIAIAHETMTLEQSLAKLGIKLLCATTFTKLNELPPEIRIKIWKEIAETGRTTDSLHYNYWCPRYHSKFWVSKPKDLMVNAEAFEESRNVHGKALPSMPRHCPCAAKFGDEGPCTGMMGHDCIATLQVNRWHCMRWDPMVLHPDNAAAAMTIKQMAATYMACWDRSIWKRVAVEFCVDELSDCVWRDKYYTILMAPKDAARYQVHQEASSVLAESGESSNSEWVQVHLAAGNLHGVETVCNLQELIIIRRPSTWDPLGWTEELAMKHVMLRLDIVRTEHPGFKNPKVTMLEHDNVSEYCWQMSIHKE